VAICIFVPADNAELFNIISREHEEIQHLLHHHMKNNDEELLQIQIFFFFLSTLRANILVLNEAVHEVTP
jgi:hypothetical protein